MNRKVTMVLAMIAAVVLAAFSFFFFGSDVDANEEVSLVVGSGEGSSVEGEEGDVKGEDGILDKILGSIFGGGASGDGGASGGSILDNGCVDIRFSHALKNFNETISCTSYVNGNCASLVANCTVEINHLDDEAPAGEFIVRYDLTDKNTSEILATDTFTDTLEYQDNLLFVAEFNLEDDDGISENLECAFKTISIPTNEIC